MALGVLHAHLKAGDAGHRSEQFIAQPSSVRAFPYSFASLEHTHSFAMIPIAFLASLACHGALHILLGAGERRTQGLAAGEPRSEQFIAQPSSVRAFPYSLASLEHTHTPSQ